MIRDLLLRYSLGDAEPLSAWRVLWRMIWRM